ncbi:MAG: cobalamin B12-binding domain-containing protein, partial [Planctomycetes bacterium]|nr:cobalamin B12-binding domain-containing protein [Planctomycetota bacterium]
MAPSSEPGRTWRVLLINPPFQRLKGVYNLYFPLGLGYLAGSLKVAGFDCGIYNVENAQLDEVVPHNHLSLLEQHWMFIDALKKDDHFVWREVRDTIRNFRPDILGVSVLTPIYGSAVRVNQIAREVVPNIPIIWGGPHPTVQAREILEDEPNVTAVVMGEGELTMADLCARIRRGETDFSQVDGTAWRGPQGVKVNKPREYADDLDALPWPDKSASLYIDAYFRDPERAQLGNVFGSRGCPFKCAYCSSHTIWTRKVRYRSPESVVEEMKTLQRDFGVERFSFLDDTFTMNRKWATSICEKIKQENVRGRWGCYTRLDVLTEPLLETMQ